MSSFGGGGGAADPADSSGHEYSSGHKIATSGGATTTTTATYSSNVNNNNNFSSNSLTNTTNTTTAAATATITTASSNNGAPGGSGCGSLSSLTGARKLDLCAACGQFHEAGATHLYDYNQPVDNDLLCKLCQQPLVDPLDTKCGHTFCTPCLKGHLARQALCPIDKSIINFLECSQASSLVKKLLDKLLVVCPNVDYCEEVLPRSSLESHLTHRCRGAVTRCSNAALGCGFQGPKTALQNHLLECPFRSEDEPPPMEPDYYADWPPKEPIASGAVSTIDIQRGCCDLGVSFVGGCDTPLSCIVIQEIYIDGLVAKDSRLRPGDQILEVNGEDLTQATHWQAKRALSQLTPLCRLTVYREPTAAAAAAVAIDNENDEEEEEDDFLGFDPATGERLLRVTLYKRAGMRLGIKLVGKKTCPGLFILGLVSGGLAELDGRLRRDDRILEINGVDIGNGTQEEAAAIIHSAPVEVSFLVSRRPSQQQQPMQPRPQTPDVIRRTNYDAADGDPANSDGAVDAAAATYANEDYPDCNEAATPDPADASVGEFNRSNDSTGNGRRQCLPTKEEEDFATPPPPPPPPPEEETAAAEGDLASSIGEPDSPPPPPPPQMSSASLQAEESVNDNRQPPRAVKEDEEDEAGAEAEAEGEAEMEQEEVEEELNPAERHQQQQEEGEAEEVSRHPASYLASAESVNVRLVTLTKSAPNESLGMSVAGGLDSQRGDIPVYVTNLPPDGLAARSRQIRKGDVVLAVNDVSLLGLTHEEAVRVLKSQPGPPVTIRLLPGPETSSGGGNFMPSWVYWLALPPVCSRERRICLPRDPHTGSLGFSIVGGCDSASGPQPIIVKSIVHGGPAHVQGQLRCGDLVLRVNDLYHLGGVTHGEAVSLLKLLRTDTVALSVVSWPGTIV